MVKYQNISSDPGSFGVIEKSNISVSVETPTAAFSKDGIHSASNITLDASAFNDETGIKINNKKISAWGSNNLFPNDLKSIYSNNIISGLFDFKQDMFFGAGPRLYTLDENGNKKATIDNEISDFLDSLGFIDYLISIFADAAMYENMFSQIIPNKGKDKIAKIIHVDAAECRLSVINPKSNKSDFLFVNRWGDLPDISAATYPSFDIKEPFKSNISMVHLKKKSAGFKYYAMPVYVGILEFWLPLANEIPKFHLSRLQKSLNIKYHIKIPIKSLEQTKELNRFSKDQLDEWLKNKLEQIDELLTGSANVGKTFYTFTEHDSNGKEMAGWQILEVKNNEKEMSEANLELYNETNQAITSAMQVQPSLACIQLGQKMSSGSEILNAYNLHVRTRTPIIRHLALSPINTALKINYPNKKIFVDIADPLLVKQEIDKSGVAE
jgi:hypothetical protein